MAEPFVGQIMMVGFGFPPRGWAFCDGQLMAISQNDALFSLLGTTFGGDGRTTFGLPDFRSRTPVHVGQGPGLSHYWWGQKGGSENITITSSSMPSHTHTPACVAANGNQISPVNHVWAADNGGNAIIYSNQQPNMPMSPKAVSGIAGGGQSHTNVQPFLSIYFCIALFGVYPPRS